LKTRKRTISVPKEDNFICGKCSTRGSCDEKGSNTEFYWDEDEKKIICKKCGHRLTTEKELKDEILITEIQQYGFWLRFISEHFIPCKKCQEELDKIFNLMWTRLTEETPNDCTIDLGNPFCITLHILRNKNDLIEFRFTLAFVSPSPVDSYTFVPCDEECQGRLWRLFSEKEMHIGNDEKPLIELWRNWEYLEEPDEKTKERIKDWAE